ncbi:RAMP superfamily CRISPR-associated protein [Bacillus ndiopicus]|uniref:RAMP superfamily CRISPR-associated protein n=1 Tax=Bacillus ndiopicus TaxID=1347368 RepID=UPI0005A7CCC1|nr:RAMP superfamily CRISPR-associated protein [Bacillus ndiopicus]
MSKYELIITLRSPLSPGSGDSIAGVVDQEITHEHGIPIIPAKRIKGALRGVAKELVEWGFVEVEEVDKLFGQPGSQDSSGFKIYDATLNGLPAYYFNKNQSYTIKEYEQFITQIKAHNEQEVLPLFTMLYTKTAIAQGKAETGSLRTIRVINKGLVFKSVIELDSDKQSTLLKNCAKGLRHLGYGRTRGLGEVNCEVKLIDENTNKKTIATKGTGAFRITLQQPALLAGEKGLYYSCTNFIPGSALLGVFASLYIKKHKSLGQQAHEDETFARLFLRGGIAFGYAYPEVDARKFIPCPTHLQRIKNKDVVMYEGNNKGDKTLRKISTLAHKEDNNLYLYEPLQEFRMHHARPEDRQYGRALNDTLGTEGIQGEKGQFYYYTALQKGQQFVGELKGEAEDIKLLFDLLKDNDGAIHLGRSRTAEYGAAKLEAIEQLPSIGFEEAQTGDTKVAIYLATPLTLQNETGRYVADTALLIKQFERKLGTTLNIENMYLKQTTLTGYNAKWRLPKPERLAFDAGTVFVVSTNQQDVDWGQLTDEHWGAETAQGCGEVYVLAHVDTQEMTAQNLDNNVESSRGEKLPLTREIDVAIKKAKAIKLAQIEIQTLAKGYNALSKYSNTKLYQLEQYILKAFDLPAKYKVELENKSKEILNHIGSLISKELFNEEPLNQDIKELLVKDFFHAVRLEVRKNANE